MIVYKCPCGEVYKAADDQAGTVVVCAACARRLVVPRRKGPVVPIPEGVLTYKCRCGRSYRLNYHRGIRRVQCPVCGAWEQLGGERASG